MNLSGQQAKGPKVRSTAAMLLAVTLCSSVAAQDDNLRVGSRVPAELNALFSRGASYLEKTQNKDGSWPSQNLFQSNGTGVCSLCVLALLSTGEDPNFGPHATSVRRGIEFLLTKQNQSSGMVGGNAYDFGFTMLALAECYGAVDEDRLFPDVEPSKRRTIANGLELCVKAASTMKSKTELVGHRVEFDCRQRWDSGHLSWRFCAGRIACC